MELYHYTTGNGLFGIINSLELHCSHQKFLNDPTEQSYFDNVLRSILDRDAFLQTIYVELFINDYLIGSNKQKYIFSLSKNPDSLSMWNYYADGNGYNIGFNIDSIIEKNKNKIKKVEMIYEITKQKEMIKSFIESYVEDYHNYNELTDLMIKSGDASEVDKYIFKQKEIKQRFTKGINELKTSFKHAAYKDEIRLIIDKGKKGKFKVSGQGVFVEYLTLDMTPKNDIFQVMVHPLCSELHVEGMKRFIKSNIPDKEINVTISEIPFRII